MKVWIKSILVALGYFTAIGGSLAGIVWVTENVPMYQIGIGLGATVFVIATLSIRNGIFGGE